MRIQGSARFLAECSRTRDVAISDPSSTMAPCLQVNSGAGDTVGAYLFQKQGTSTSISFPLARPDRSAPSGKNGCRGAGQVEEPFPGHGSGVEGERVDAKSIARARVLNMGRDFLNLRLRLPGAAGRSGSQRECAESEVPWFRCLKKKIPGYPSTIPGFPSDSGRGTSYRA